MRQGKHTRCRESPTDQRTSDVALGFSSTSPSPSRRYYLGTRAHPSFSLELASLKQPRPLSVAHHSRVLTAHGLPCGPLTACHTQYPCSQHSRQVHATPVLKNNWVVQAKAARSENEGCARVPESMLIVTPSCRPSPEATQRTKR
jgi:hypothetical protein